MMLVEDVLAACQSGLEHPCDLERLTAVQRTYLELIAAVEYNEFHGRGVVRALLEHRALWDSDPDTVLAQVIERFEQFV